MLFFKSNIIIHLSRSFFERKITNSNIGCTTATFVQFPQKNLNLRTIIQPRHRVMSMNRKLPLPTTAMICSLTSLRILMTCNPTQLQRRNLVTWILHHPKIWIILKPEESYSYIGATAIAIALSIVKCSLTQLGKIIFHLHLQMRLH